MKKRSKWVKRGFSVHGTGPVANMAVGGRRVNRKMAARLEARVKDFELFMSARNSHGGIQQRKETGGFHKPGSNQ